MIWKIGLIPVSYCRENARVIVAAFFVWIAAYYLLVVLGDHPSVQRFEYSIEGMLFFILPGCFVVDFIGFAVKSLRG